MKFKLNLGTLEGLVPECYASAILFASCFRKANNHIFKKQELNPPIEVTQTYILRNCINGSTYKDVSRKAVNELGELDIMGLFVEETPVTSISEELTSGGHMKVSILKQKGPG